MTIELRKAYLETIRERYKNAPKKAKGAILSEFCAVCGYSRKYAIRILCRRLEPRVKKPGPKVIYGDEVRRHLVTLWESMNRMCSKKMVVGLQLWLPYYKGDINEETRKLLLTISASTIDRLLEGEKKVRGLSTTKASHVKSRIPIQLLDSEITEPGYMEADTVAHCGGSIEGEYAHTITATDLFSGWTENRAIWTKSAVGVIHQVTKIEENLPFRLKGFACDNGTEFLNEGLESHLKHRLLPVEFVRRRPYHKNDAAHVEQKNFTHVRELFGYQRFKDPKLVNLMNEIYRVYWNPLWNFYTPVMKLKSKTRAGGRIVKKYDKPQTPMQRLLNSPHLTRQARRELKERLATTNPFYLKAELDKKLKLFFSLVDKQKYRLTGS